MPPNLRDGRRAMNKQNLQAIDDLLKVYYCDIKARARKRHNSYLSSECELARQDYFFAPLMRLNHYLIYRNFGGRVRGNINPYHPANSHNKLSHDICYLLWLDDLSRCTRCSPMDKPHVLDEELASLYMDDFIKKRTVT